MKKSYTNLALEAIRHGANTTLFPRLTELFEGLMSKAKAGATIVVPDLDPAAAMVQEELGVRAVMLPSDKKSYDFYTQPADLDANSPMAQDYYRWLRDSADGVQKLAKSSGVLRGAVDLQTGRVSGCFSEVKVPICLGLGWFNAKQIMSGGEIAAAFLHEVGHNITYFEALSESLTANAVILAVAQDWLSSDRMRRVKLLDALNNTNMFGIDPKSRDAITQIDDAEKMVAVLVSGDYYVPRSMQRTRGNDLAQYESASDQFSVRMGAGKELATGLDKLHRNWGMRESAAGQLALGIFQGIAAAGIVAITIGGIIGSLAVPPAAAALTAVSLFLKLGFLTSDAAYDQFNIYDGPRKRIERIIIQYKASLKDAHLPPEQTRKTLSTLEELGKMINEYGQTRSWGEYVLNAVVRSRGRQIDQRRREELIEHLSSNDLYSVAAALRTQ